MIGVAFDGTRLRHRRHALGRRVPAWPTSTGSSAPRTCDRCRCPAATAAITEPWRMAAAYLDAAYGDECADRPRRRSGAERRAVGAGAGASARAGVNTPLTSSAGRLFDAVAALVGVRDDDHLRGPGGGRAGAARPIRRETGAYPARHRCRRLAVIGRRRSGAGGRSRTCAPASRRRRSSRALPQRASPTAIVRGVRAASRERTGLATVALSGGVFQNRCCSNAAVDGAGAAGFACSTHRRVPPNDGGISLGQAAVAGARDRATAKSDPERGWPT